MSLSLFPWAHFCRGKAAVKLHVGLDHDGLLPAFGTVTHGHISDIEVARTLDLPKQSIVVCDRGYQDYEWFKSLTERDIYFVTRLKKDALHNVVDRRKVDKRYGLICDQTIKLTGTKSRKMVMPDLRKVSYRDPETGQHYVYDTNLFHLSAKTIVAIYKDRWQIELFFK